jgi:hypothetical protein
MVPDHPERRGRSTSLRWRAAEKSPGFPRVSGSFGFFPPLGFVRVRRRSGSFGFAARSALDPPGLNAIWEQYPISAAVTTAI